MKIGFFPGAVPNIAKLANEDPAGMMGVLQKAQSIACGKTENHRLSDISIFPMNENDDGFKVAVAYEDGIAIAVDAGAGVNLESAEIITGRLNRVANWKQHIVELELEGITAPELGNTLSDVIGFLDATIAPKDDPILEKNNATQAFLAPPSLNKIPDNFNYNKFLSSVRKWTSSDARRKQKDLYDLSHNSPQCVERPDGKRAYVISEHHLKSLFNKNPLTALEMIEAVKGSNLEPFSMAETGRSKPLKVPNITPIS